MDASTTQTVAEGLTSGDWLGIIGLMAALAASLGMIIFNMVMKKLDAISAKQEVQGRNITRICTHLGVEEDT